MDEKTLTALKGSIAKWEAIVEGTGEDDGPDNCPLCQLFHGKPKFCKGCPVQEPARGKVVACIYCGLDRKFIPEMEIEP